MTSETQLKVPMASYGVLQRTDNGSAISAASPA